MANDHKTCMSEVVTNLLLVKNLKVISEAKYDKIVEHLRPYMATDPKLRWWIKRKQFELISFLELNIAVIPKRCTYVTVGLLLLYFDILACFETPTQYLPVYSITHACNVYSNMLNALCLCTMNVLQGRFILIHYNVDVHKCSRFGPGAIHKVHHVILFRVT